MSGHTPGPWSIVIDDSGDRPIAVPSIQAAEEYDCAIVHWDGFWQEHWQSARGNKEMHANARLIAAAPELLAACVKFVRRVEAGQVRSKLTYAAMKAAIARATGESA